MVVIMIMAIPRALFFIGQWAKRHEYKAQNYLYLVRKTLAFKKLAN